MNNSSVNKSLSLEKTAHASRLARRWVQQTLGDNASVALVRDSLLLTSELVTNATLHTDDGCRVSLHFDPDRQHVRVEVSDTSTDEPQPQDAPRPRGGGLGLHLVDDLASEWGTIVTPGGKTVWFELEADPPECRPT